MCEKTKCSTVISGHPGFPIRNGKDGRNPSRTSYREYVEPIRKKTWRHGCADQSDAGKMFRSGCARMNRLKVHAAAFANGGVHRRHRSPARREVWAATALGNMSTFGALDEYRHNQIPLCLFHQLVRLDPSRLGAQVLPHQ